MMLGSRECCCKAAVELQKCVWESALESTAETISSQALPVGNAAGSCFLSHSLTNLPLSLLLEVLQYYSVDVAKISS